MAHPSCRCIQAGIFGRGGPALLPTAVRTSTPVGNSPTAKGLEPAVHKHQLESSMAAARPPSWRRHPAGRFKVRLGDRPVGVKRQSSSRGGIPVRQSAPDRRHRPRAARQQAIGGIFRPCERGQPSGGLFFNNPIVAALPSSRLPQGRATIRPSTSTSVIGHNIIEQALVMRDD